MLVEGLEERKLLTSLPVIVDNSDSVNFSKTGTWYTYNNLGLGGTVLLDDPSIVGETAEMIATVMSVRGNLSEHLSFLEVISKFGYPILRMEPLLPMRFAFEKSLIRL